MNNNAINKIEINTYDEMNEYELDDHLLLNFNKDEKRKKEILNIKLENNFYKTYLNLFRILINKNNNNSLKIKLLQLLNDKNNYIEKLQIIFTFLKEFMKKHINFSNGLNTQDYENFTHLSTCINKSEDECKLSKCIWNVDTCQLLLPKKNLLSGENNEEIYTAKMSDELIRNYKKRLYLLEKNQYMVLKELPYKINDDEILVLEEQLFNDYLNNIDSVEKNKFYNIKNSYDFIEPSKVIKHNIEYDLSKYLNNEIDDFYEEKISESKQLQSKIKKLKSKK